MLIICEAFFFFCSYFLGVANCNLITFVSYYYLNGLYMLLHMNVPMLIFK